jgi:hypothetical protein
MVKAVNRRHGGRPIADRSIRARVTGPVVWLRVEREGPLVAHHASVVYEDLAHDTRSNCDLLGLHE